MAEYYRPIPTEGYRMDLEEAIEIIERHNRWRRGSEDFPENPTRIGKAIDLIVSSFKRIPTEDEIIGTQKYRKSEVPYSSPIRISEQEFKIFKAGAEFVINKIKGNPTVDLAALRYPNSDLNNLDDDNS